MTAAEVADWMVLQLAERATLYQSTVASHVARENRELVYRNKNGNWALDKTVLAAFRAKTPGDEIVWSRSSQLWRHRRPNDKPGRQQR
ncbi:DUF6953 family protein [Sphingomonas montanisoli]|uniref:Uncharacterized protein n=1 Tax=Sphingomonas montanisoli TaxID=2606412 RepID=A0A5D9C7A3_9SPHN|nr:hypothetical protein [Sphingomonas montanisoli]TZG27127.1 hypothetical protein FYJ91_05715 [Sphingomonas montanisoli]